MSAFPVLADGFAAYPAVEGLATKLAKKSKWTVGRENYLLADFAAMLLVLGRETDLQRLGTWLVEEHPFRGSFNVWDGIAHAQAVCCRGVSPARRPALWASIHQHYATGTASLRMGKMEDGELRLIQLDERRASVRSAIPSLTGVLRSQAFTWVLLQDPAAAKKFRGFDQHRLEALIANASTRLWKALGA